MVANKRAFILTKEDYLIDNFCFFVTVPIGIWETILETYLEPSQTSWNFFKKITNGGVTKLEISCGRHKRMTHNIQKSSPTAITATAAAMNIPNKWTTEAATSGILLKRSSSLLNKRFWHSCFPVNFAIFLRTSLLQNTSGWLFLMLAQIMK